MKNATKMGGFRGFEGNRNRFENGLPMLRGESAPFLNVLEDKPQVCFSRASLVRMKRFHRGNTRFFSFQVVASGTKKGSIFEPLK